MPYPITVTQFTCVEHRSLYHLVPASSLLHDHGGSLNFHLGKEKRVITPLLWLLQLGPTQIPWLCSHMSHPAVPKMPTSHALTPAAAAPSQALASLSSWNCSSGLVFQVPWSPKETQAQSH